MRCSMAEENVIPVPGMLSGRVMRIPINLSQSVPARVRQEPEEPHARFEYSNSKPGSRGSV
jgi:hypothetical protein